MINVLRKHVKNLTVEDKIVLLRFKIGLIYGFTIFIASFLVSPANLTPFAWATSIIVYYFTVLYVSLKYGLRSKFLIYLRGLATFYGTWLLVSILLNEFSLVIGVKN
ncbi:MAG: hypothetical protein QXT75_02175 [Desulfurococcaceae archaeon]